MHRDDKWTGDEYELFKENWIMKLFCRIPSGLFRDAPDAAERQIITTKKFLINANGNKLDIWLIYLPSMNAGRFLPYQEKNISVFRTIMNSLRGCMDGICSYFGQTMWISPLQIPVCSLKCSSPPWNHSIQRNSEVHPPFPVPGIHSTHIPEKVIGCRVGIWYFKETEQA